MPPWRNFEFDIALLALPNCDPARGWRGGKLIFPRSQEVLGVLLVRAAQALTSVEAIASQPTAEMRKELEEAGVELPEGLELTALSRRYNEGLDASRQKGNKHANSATSWAHLFNEVCAAWPQGAAARACARRGRVQARILSCPCPWLSRAPRACACAWHAHAARCTHSSYLRAARYQSIWHY